jgi:hypothetical protein
MTGKQKSFSERDCALDTAATWTKHPPRQQKTFQGDRAMQRPTAATVFGILNIAFAVLGFFGGIASYFTIFVLTQATNNLVFKIINEQPVLRAWTLFATVVGLVFAVLQMVSGIGLLQMKAWARVMAIYYGIAAIVLGVAGMMFNGIFLIGPLMAEAEKSSGPEAAGAIGGAIGGTVGGFCGLIYPILLLIFMTRPKLVAAFKAPVPPPVA